MAVVGLGVGMAIPVLAQYPFRVSYIEDALCADLLECGTPVPAGTPEPFVPSIGPATLEPSASPALPTASPAPVAPDPSSPASSGPLPSLPLPSLTLPSLPVPSLPLPSLPLPTLEPLPTCLPVIGCQPVCEALCLDPLPSVSPSLPLPSVSTVSDIGGYL